MDSLKADWPVYLSSAGMVVPLLTWFAKWAGIMPNGGSTPYEVIVFAVAVPSFLRLCLVRFKDEGQA